MKIAFAFFGSDSWNSGIVYLETLLRALHQTYADQFTLCLIGNQSSGVVPDEMRKIIDEVLVYPEIRRWTLDWIINIAGSRIFQRDIVKDIYLRRNGVDAIALGVSPQGSKIPSLAWIPDFQHRHMPEMFSEQERMQRDLGYLCTARSSTKIILLSESVRHDFESFVPGFSNKVRVLSPVSQVPRSVYESNPLAHCNQYHLPLKFIYLPNQFWKHKNHIAAFRALKILRARGEHVFLVCSGYPGDYRYPTYFAELLQQLSELGIRDQVALLGLLPRDHVFGLMRQSVCVLNPSFFEGFGMTVEEAHSVGKLVLASDIPAHREQGLPRIVFFDPRNEEDLAVKLEQVWQEQLPGPDLNLELEARQTQPQRIHQYAQSFMSIVHEVDGA